MHLTPRRATPPSTSDAFLPSSTKSNHEVKARNVHHIPHTKVQARLSTEVLRSSHVDQPTRKLRVFFEIILSPLY